ncbi:MAG: DUF3570 domain-containing protein [Polyangiaceae bacterium]|nr:DUF3570 domain-containing protein [Polyangiaceae bacterium]
MKAGSFSMVSPSRVVIGAVAFAVTVGVTSAARAEGSDISFRTRTEVSGYKDTDATNVLTPGVRAEVENVPAGWAIGASLLVDVVTTASADIVATASPKWTDERYVPGLDARFKISDATLSLAANGSIESDYYAGTGSVGLAIDLAEKTITPSFSYSFGYDVAGRRHTPLSVYSLELMRHSLSAYVSFVINKSTIFVPGVSGVLEIGDQEKPYRYLPTFTEGTEVPVGASADEVNLLRTSVRLAENTPDLRHRYSASALVAHRFDNATIRVEERLYIDNWLLMATTTDATLPIDVTSAVRIWPHLRFHAQKGVDFWSRAYVIDETSAGVVAPQLRTGDRELGPMIAATGGAGLRVGDDHVGFTISADAIYTRFLDALFIQDRVAGFGALVFDAEVD